MIIVGPDSPHYKEIMNAQRDQSDFCHILASLSHQAKRISSSASIAETLSATSGKELGELVVIGLIEVFGIGLETPLHEPASLSLLTKLQESGAWATPIHHYNDCRDLLQLVVTTGSLSTALHSVSA